MTSVRARENKGVKGSQIKRLASTGWLRCPLPESLNDRRGSRPVDFSPLITAAATSLSPRRCRASASPEVLIDRFSADSVSSRQIRLR